MTPAGHEAVSVAAVQRPEGEALPWQAAQAAQLLGDFNNPKNGEKSCNLMGR